MELRRVGVWSCAKIAAALYAIIGFVFGAILTVFSLIGAAVGAAAGAEDQLLGMLFGVGAVVLVPLFYGVLGAVVVALAAALYNLVARYLGGIELDLVSTTAGGP